MWVSYVAIYVPIIMYGLRLFYIVYRYVPFLFHGRYGYLSVRKVSFLTLYGYWDTLVETEEQQQQQNENVLLEF